MIEFKPKGTKKTEGASQQSDYVGRAKAESKRFELATDSEFWVAICFREEGERVGFLKRFNLPSDMYIKGAIFREATKGIRPDKIKRGFAKQKHGAPFPDPLKGVDYTDSLEADCLAEAYALMDAFQKVKRPNPCKEPTDSDIWFCVVFDDRDDKDAYLTDWNLLRFGDKYLDGSAWLKDMN
jgi:hypothetical protein